MKERPILFSAPMVRAILEGRKTQTRRVVKKVSADCFGWFDDGDCEFAQRFLDERGNPHLKAWRDKCPYGQPGDRLWVREAFSGPHCMDASDGCKAVPPSKWGDCSRIWYWADGNPTEGDWTRPRPSIHMPRWASRILLEITGVRVERLNDIGVSDAIVEGYDGSNPSPVDPSIKWYADLWESINGAGSWTQNPWVWVVEFRRIDK